MSEKALAKFDFSKAAAVARACIPDTREERAERMQDITVCSPECGLQWLAKEQRGELEPEPKGIELCWQTGHVIKTNISLVLDEQLIQNYINNGECLILRPMK